jgi:hypothetical protein
MDHPSTAEEVSEIVCGGTVKSACIQVPSVVFEEEEKEVPGRAHKAFFSIA